MPVVSWLSGENWGRGVTTAPAMSKKCSAATAAPIGKATTACIQRGRGFVQSHNGHRIVRMTCSAGRARTLCRLRNPAILLYLSLDRASANLGVARLALKQIERAISD